MSTANFSDTELACRCGCGGLPPQEFQDELQRLRDEYGRPMRISSAWRCPDHNDRVSKTGRNGPHTRGAVDVLVFGTAVWDLDEIAKEFGWHGIGKSQKGPFESRFIHLDRRPFERRTEWSY